MESDYVANAGLPIYLNSDTIFVVVGFSMVADFVIASLICFNKDLHVHPMRLFMLASVSEASYFQAVFTGKYACSMGWIELFQTTVMFNTDFEWDTPRRWHTVQILYNAQSFFMLFFWMMSIFINVVICYDLIWILYNPFKSPETNIKVSLALCFVAAFYVGI